MAVKLFLHHAIDFDGRDWFYCNFNLSSLNNHKQTMNQYKTNNFNVRYKQVIIKVQFHFSPWGCSFIFSFVSVEYVSPEYNLFVYSKFH